jgi:hypothetical protein
MLNLLSGSSKATNLVRIPTRQDENKVETITSRMVSARTFILSTFRSNFKLKSTIRYTYNITLDIRIFTYYIALDIWWSKSWHRIQCIGGVQQKLPDHSNKRIKKMMNKKRILVGCSTMLCSTVRRSRLQKKIRKESETDKLKKSNFFLKKLSIFDLT